eukprot:g9222.t1
MPIEKCLKKKRGLQVFFLLLFLLPGLAVTLGDFLRPLVAVILGDFLRPLAVLGMVVVLVLVVAVVIVRFLSLSH